jgi:hypothetical protein
MHRPEDGRRSNSSAVMMKASDEVCVVRLAGTGLAEGDQFLDRLDRAVALPA